jgi:hypothetical protein
MPKPWFPITACHNINSIDSQGFPWFSTQKCQELPAAAGAGTSHGHGGALASNPCGADEVQELADLEGGKSESSFSCWAQQHPATSWGYNECISV